MMFAGSSKFTIQNYIEPAREKLISVRLIHD